MVMNTSTGKQNNHVGINEIGTCMFLHCSLKFMLKLSFSWFRNEGKSS